MTPERAEALLKAITVVRDELPFVAMVVDSIDPAAAPFVNVAEKGLARLFEVASVYLAKQGKEAEDEIRKRLLKDWGALTGADFEIVE